MNKSTADDLFLSTLPMKQPITFWTDDPGCALAPPPSGEVMSPLNQGGYAITGFIPPVSNRIYEAHQRYQDRRDFVVVRLVEHLRQLKSDIERMRTEIHRLQETKTFSVPLSTLEPEPLEMMKPIFVTIHGEGENFTASFTEANISASGDTAADAIENFKGCLASRFEILQSKSPEEMGALPTRQWRILQSVVKPIE